MAMNEWWSLGVTQQWIGRVDRTVSVRAATSSGNDRQRGLRCRRAARPARLEADLSFVVPVSNNWNLYGRWNYSLHDNQTIEALAGFEWDSCCMAVRLVGRQFIRSFNSQENLGLYLEIELKGLGSFGRDTGRLLDDAILGYTR
jgi:LPS-assembly protein